MVGEKSRVELLKDHLGVEYLISKILRNFAVKRKREK